MQLQIHFINIVLNKLMNIFSIRIFPYFFPLETNLCMGKDFIFSDEESENKSLKIFHKIHKEASWSFFLTLTQNDLSVLQEIYLDSKE